MSQLCAAHGSSAAMQLHLNVKCNVLCLPTQGLTSLTLCDPELRATPKAFTAALRSMTRLQRLELGDLKFITDQERR
jgi:hypothetical protein